MSIMSVSVMVHGYQKTQNQPIEPVMVTIPAGSLSLVTEKGVDTNKKINLPSFAIGKYEVTVAEFRKFIAATNYPMPENCYHKVVSGFTSDAPGSWDRNNLTTSEYQPVTCITWQAANAYTQWLVKETGRPYRLPSEAEWEYSARGGTTSDYYFGEENLKNRVCQYENVKDLSYENEAQITTNTNAWLKWDCIDHATYASIVGTYKANPFGLHDMLSNVSELLQDCYSPQFSGEVEQTYQSTEEQCAFRVRRGGDSKYGLKPVYKRSRQQVEFPGSVEGFRVAMDGKAPKQAEQTRPSAEFLKHLHIAQQSELKRRAAMPNYPEPVQNLVLKQSEHTNLLTWQKSDDPKIAGYRVYRSYSNKGPLQLIAMNVLDNEFIDANVDDFNYRYAVVAVKNFLQSKYSNAVVSNREKTHQVPGIIEAEESIGAHNNVVKVTNDLTGRYHLGGWRGVSNKTTALYKVNVKKAGYYALSYRVASQNDNQGFTLKVNGKDGVSNPVSDTGGFDHWQTQTGKQVYFQQGENTLELNVLDDRWRLNWLTLK